MPKPQKTKKKVKPQYTCGLCRGTGSIETSRDMHRSAGIIPCTWCGGTGKREVAP